MNEHWKEWPVVRGWNSVQDIFSVLNGRGYIAGSYAAWMASPGDHIKPGDIDIFATSDANVLMLVDDLCSTLDAYVVSASEQGTVYRLERIHRDPKAERALPIQVIAPHPGWVNYPADVLEWFDLDVSRAVLVNPEKVLGDENIGCFDGKLLRISDPLRSLKRVMKYHRRAVEFTDWELLKLFQAWDLIAPEQKQTMIDRAHDAAFPTMAASADDPDYEFDGYDSYRFD